MWVSQVLPALTPRLMSKIIVAAACSKKPGVIFVTHWLNFFFVLFLN